MTEPTVTLVVSDLHVGAGPLDPGEDHIHDDEPLAKFIRGQMVATENAGKRLELYFNGDFLEFAQANQAAFSLVSDAHWCTELESMAKLDTIVKGNVPIFDALAAFAAAGHQVTVAAGNHDVDLYWPAVQQQLRTRIGQGLKFELGQQWVARHGGKLQIAHGHMEDPANKFTHWDNPILTMDFGVQRLEMCPGTLFMVKFVNRMEAQYPFADNLLPVTKLASVLMREDWRGAGMMGWAFLAFAGGSPLATLGADAADQGPAAAILARPKQDAAFRAAVESALVSLGDQGLVARWCAQPQDDKVLGQAMLALYDHMDPSAWRTLFEPPADATLGAGDEVTLGATAQALFQNTKKELQAVARDRAIRTGAKFVVMGHTHEEEEYRLPNDGWYFNPGCWIRYLDTNQIGHVTLEQLKDEKQFPYKLNHVRVEALPDGGIDGKMIAVKEKTWSR